MRSTASPGSRLLRRRRGPVRRSGERGASVVEFSMVAVLLSSLFIVILQVGIYLHQRNVAATSVQAAARYAANADVETASGSDRARELIASSVSPAAAAGLDCSSRELVGDAGLIEVEVHCVGSFPSLASALGNLLPVDVVGRAVKEGQT